MKIAQIAPLYETIPPKAYGGTERIVAYLTNALVEQDHDVTLFASAEAVTEATLVACRSQALWLDQRPGSDMAAHINLLRQVQARADEFDILHFHLDLLHFPLFADHAERTVTTVHGRLDFTDLDPCYQHFSDFPIVSIAAHQQTPLPSGRWAGMVHHGLPLDLYRLTTCPRGDYLAFLGRVSPEKGLIDAIEIAQRSGLRLKIAAKINEQDRTYFREEIVPRLDDPLVEFLGEIDDTAKQELLGHARALLFPIDWPEPFGLAMIEAMACGTPVIAYPNGSVPEVVDDGVTGLIVAGIDQAATAVREISRLDRLEIRQQFERRFSAAVMANGYAQIYRALLRRNAPLKVAWPDEHDVAQCG
ncbi:MAG: glycosyltransferase family 4 protein [Geminicoccaceae bacterium]